MTWLPCPPAAGEPDPDAAVRRRGPASRRRRARRSRGRSRAGPGSSTPAPRARARSTGRSSRRRVAGERAGSRGGRTARTSRSTTPGCPAGRTAAPVPPSGAVGACRTRTACPGWTATRHRSMWPTFSNASLTTSYGPTDTPPDTTIASALAGQRGAQPRLDVLEPVHGDPERPAARRRPSRRARARPGPFASGIPAGPRSRPAGTHLVAGREHGDARPPVDANCGTPGARREGDAGARDRRPGLEDRRRPAREVAAGAPDRAADARPPRGRGTPRAAGPSRRGRAARGSPAASSGVVSSTGTTASAPGGTGAPVAIRTRRAAADLDLRRLARARPRRRPRAGPGASSVAPADVGGADRVAVHRRVVPRRQRRRADDRLGEDAAERRRTGRRPRSRSGPGRRRGPPPAPPRPTAEPATRRRRGHAGSQRQPADVGPGPERDRDRAPGEHAASAVPSSTGSPSRRDSRSRSSRRSATRPGATIGSVGDGDHDVGRPRRRPVAPRHAAQLARADDPERARRRGRTGSAGPSVPSRTCVANVSSVRLRRDRVQLGLHRLADPDARR